MVHVVAYDLRVPNDTPDNYELLIGHLKSTFGIWARIEKSVWLIETPMTAAQVRDSLMAVMHANDVLFVAPLRPGWASAWLDKERVDWLKGRSF